ncbi:MAG: hypothetical protein ACXIUB_06790 [Wenzhouxiangella sp.]
MKGTLCQQETTQRSWVFGGFWLAFALAVMMLPVSVLAQVERGWDLQLLVNNDVNRPVADARVELVFHDATRVLVEGTTDYRGRASLTVPTRKPVNLGPLNLLVHVEAEGYAPELQKLAGSPDQMVAIQMSAVIDRSWSQRNGPALRQIAAAAAGTLDLLISNQPAAAPSVSAGVAVVSGDKNLALPPGWGEIERDCQRAGPANFVLNGKIAFGRHRGRSVQEVCRPVL